MDDKVKVTVERLQEGISDGHYSSWGQKSDIELIITAAEKAERLAGALKIALSQWKMHAEMYEETDCLSTGDTDEARFYRQQRDILKEWEKAR